MSTDAFAEARAAMVRDQVELRGLRHPAVLAAMREVPRHEFVSRDQQAWAYEDRPLPIGYGQTISQPYMVAVMTVTLEPSAEDRVLEVGTGSGYQTAVLARLVREVVSIEFVAALASQARATLERLEIRNVTVVTGDGSLGYPARQPYDGILVAAGAPAVPEMLVDQLAAGGRLVIPVGTRAYQELFVIRKNPGGITEERREGCVFVPLKGERGWGG